MAVRYFYTYLYINRESTFLYSFVYFYSLCYGAAKFDFKEYKMEKTERKKRTRGRPGTFDREKVLHTVMHMFWEHGYDKQSFNDIAQETGFTRASLYNTFKSKDDLFLEALNHYYQNSPDNILLKIKDGDPIGATLYTVLKNAAKMYITDPLKRGCMGVNSTSELMGRDGDLNERVGEIYELYKKRLQAIVEQAVKQQELPRSINTEITANMIFAFMNGYSIFSKSNSNQEEMNAMAHSFLTGLGFQLSHT